MDKLSDGQYRTWPNNSPETEENVRIAYVENSLVRVDRFRFTQEDFFSVNKLVPTIPIPSSEKA
jgi:hypothetical protein